MTSLPIHVVEAFTYLNNAIFTGNTAAVCVLDHDAQVNDETKQLIARDMNLSETAFVSKRWTAPDKSLPPNEWTLRWFTPTAEVPLCGHATLASAKVLFSHYSEGSGTGTLRFHSKWHGILGASTVPETDFITLNFPTQSPQPIGAFPEIAAKHSHWLTEVIQETLRAPLIGSPKVSSFTPLDVQLAKEGKVLLLRVKTKDDLLSLRPNFQAMGQIPTNVLFDLIVVTAQGEGEEDSPAFYSRVFAPWLGINEDPVTGVAHTVLAPYWKAVLENQGQAVPKLFNAVQLSERRGAITCELTDNGARVNLSGSSRITLKGELTI